MGNEIRKYVKILRIKFMVQVLDCHPKLYGFMVLKLCLEFGKFLLDSNGWL